MPLKIGAYIRVSTEEQASAIEGSLDNQRYRLQAFVDLKNSQEQGWGEIVDFYVDDGFSAKDTRRPAYQRVMKDVKRGRINLILIPDLSRLSRNIFDFCNLLNDLEKSKAKFLSIKEQFDTSTPAGKMMVYNMINLAQFEREQVSERVSLGAHARAMRGLLNGGRAILGYDKDPQRPGSYVVNEVEAQQVRKIFQAFLEAGSRSKTIKVLDGWGIKPKPIVYNGKIINPTWNVQTLGNLLNSAAYIGLHEVNRHNKSADPAHLKPFQRYQTVKASWPAIVDRDIFEQAQTLLEEARKQERSRLADAETRVYLLSGILRCAQCGHPMVGQSAHGSKSIVRYYGHTNSAAKHGCDIQRISADMLEEAVIGRLKSGLESAGFFNNLESRMSEVRSASVLDKAKEIDRVKGLLKTIQNQVENLFLLQMDSILNTDARQLLADKLASLASEKNTLTGYLKELEESQDQRDPEVCPSQFLRSRADEFIRGFGKAPATLKKRLLRRVIVRSRESGPVLARKIPHKRTGLKV